MGETDSPLEIEMEIEVIDPFMGIDISRILRVVANTLIAEKKEGRKRCGQCIMLESLRIGLRSRMSSSHAPV